MTKSHAVLAGPLVIGLLAVAFCIWSALGNDVNICVTTGCTLYEDFSIGGVSLWWIGTVAFSILCVCALIGQVELGRFLAGLFLLGDVGLLLLMALTAPCVSCLVIALFFALCYFYFRRKAREPKPPNGVSRHVSVLLCAWLCLFIVNIGLVARSQLDVWPILEESGDGNLRMFFSPSCKYCIDGVNQLSGNINVGFYPVADQEADVARIDKMLSLLNDGLSMAEALGRSRDASFNGFWDAYGPDALVLRFRLLRNKAHLFGQGAQGVPFFERKGLPPSMMTNAKKDASTPLPSPPVATHPMGTDPGLPAELQDTGICGAGKPCP